MKRLPILILLILVIGCQQLPIGNANPSAQNVWTGFIEGETIDISPQVGGRLANLAVAEGQSTQAGQPLFSLEDDLMQRRIEIADANVAVAEAQVKLLEAVTRPEDNARAQARVEYARAALDAADQGVKDAEALRANPQMLVILSAQAELRAKTAAQQLDAAVKQAQAADVMNSFWQDQVRGMWEGTDVTLPDGTTRHFNTPDKRMSWAQDQWNQATHDAWAAWAAVTSATANKDAADAGWQDTREQIANPLALDVKVSQASANRDRAAAAVQTAEAGLQIVRDGASPAQIATARAALDQARAARASLDRDAADYRVDAPQAGTVTRVFYRVGEVVAPAAPVVRLTIQGDMTLRVFVPMLQASSVRLDQAVTMGLPDLQNRTVNGKVSHIAQQAEFTGRQPQTDSERNAQLIAVDIKLLNPDPTIKPGMPASVSFDGTQVNVSAVLAAAAPAPSNLTFSGTLEERQTHVAAEMEGQVTLVRVNRGDEVTEGDSLINLDDRALQDALNEAQAAVRTAEANLDQVKEPARAGALALADATVMQAQADRDSAMRAADDAARVLAAAQDIKTQIHVWEGKVRAAQGDVERATAAISALQNQTDEAARDQSKSGKARAEVLQKQSEAANANLLAAQLTVEGSGAVLNLYRAQAANPLDLVAARNAAASQVKVAELGLKVAEADRTIAQRGPQPEAVALAQARVSAAQASLKLVQAQARRAAVMSPMTGRVVDRQIRAGETARPGVPLLILADTRELELTVYVPMRLMPSVHLGQAGTIRLPSLEGKSFASKVSYIAPEAEFKPANIYNSQERSEMVFAVRLAIPNASGELKAGLPADVTLQ